MSRLKAVALVLSGALASMLFCGWLIVGHIESDAGALAEAREEGYAAAEEDRLAIVVDRPIAEGNSMPLWLQTDPQWDYIPYAGGTIARLCQPNTSRVRLLRRSRSHRSWATPALPMA